MDSLTVIYDNDRPTVSGRELHDALEIKSAYMDWFPRMCAYGFIENVDFTSKENESTGGRPSVDHRLTLDMAKQICMLQRTEAGRKFRQYFIDIEKQWNSPESIMSRAAEMAHRHLEELRRQTSELLLKTAVQKQQIAEMKPKASYYDLVLACPDLITVSTIAKDYGRSARWLNQELHKLGIEYRQGNIWLLYQDYADKGYTQTKTFLHEDHNGQQHSTVHTYWTQKGRLFIYETLKNNGYLPLIEKQED